MPATMETRNDVKQVVLDHMLERFRDAEISDTPFPHFAVTDVFPQDIYAEMVDALPNAWDFLPVADRHYGEAGSSNRNQLPLAEEYLQRLPEELAGFWRGIAEALRSEELKRVVYANLAKGLSYRFSVPTEEVSSLPGVARPRIYRETAGYSIPPHPDTRKKVVTLQFALPRKRDQLDLGTGLYQLSPNPVDWFNKPKGFRGFRKVKQCAFEPNSAFAFSVINSMGMRSWHGREPLTEQSGTRTTILNVYYSSEEVADH